MQRQYRADAADVAGHVLLPGADHLDWHGGRDRGFDLYRPIQGPGHGGEDNEGGDDQAFPGLGVHTCRAPSGNEKTEVPLYIPSTRSAG
ncbi:hypothetical protein D3C81_1914960 [compost metagenome]